MGSVQRLLAISCSSPPCIVAAVASHGGGPCRGIDSGRIFSSFSSASHGTMYSQLRCRCNNIGSSFHHFFFSCSHKIAYDRSPCSVLIAAFSSQLLLNAAEVFRKAFV